MFGNINSKPDLKTILTPLCTRNDFTRKSYCSSRMVDTNGYWKIPVFQSQFCLVMYCFDGLFLFSLWFSSCQKPSKIRLGVVPVNLPIFFQWFNQIRSLNDTRNSNSDFIETLKGFVHDRKIFPLNETQISMEDRFFCEVCLSLILFNQLNKSCKIKDNFTKRSAIHRWILFVNMFSAVHQWCFLDIKLPWPLERTRAYIHRYESAQKFITSPHCVFR